MPERTSRSAGEWPGTDLVAARADATPEREAVVDAETGDAWTYRELDAWVATVAARLRDRDGDPGRIGVLSAPRPAFVALLHAGWRTGRELVPLNARLAPRELAAQLDTASVGAVLFDDENRDLTREAVTHADAPDDATMRALDAVVAEPDEATSPTGTPPADTETECVVSREDVPVTLFTSGSTGDPKPVRLTVGNLLASATASAFRLGVARGDRWLSPLPTYHMAGSHQRSGVRSTARRSSSSADSTRTPPRARSRPTTRPGPLSCRPHSTDYSTPAGRRRNRSDTSSWAGPPPAQTSSRDANRLAFPSIRPGG